MTDKPIRKIDLHIHTKISDGTDSPKEIIEKVRSAGIDLFSVTDHDAIKACGLIRENLTENDPLFISGIEFSCKDPYGKYHILGYGYDNKAGPIRSIVEKGHSMRIEKTKRRLEKIKSVFGYVFSDEDVRQLFENHNPGKPHIAKLMIKYGYADSMHDAFEKYLDRISVPTVYTLPEDAIAAILESGGIPILAHPPFGNGNDLILGDEMDQRLQRLISYGLQGVEAYYSGFTEKLQNEVLGFAEKYGLYVTAGSDYHGANKLVQLGDNNLEDIKQGSDGLLRFLEDVKIR